MGRRRLDDILIYAWVDDGWVGEERNKRGMGVWKMDMEGRG